MIQQYEMIIREKLDDFRYHHSLCVAKEAVRLADKYGADSQKAYIAGMLHDITKNFTEKEHLQLLERFGIILSEIDKTSPNLYHAITGSLYAEKILGINDSEIISAIRFHTTAREKMSLMEKVIYLADFTSEDRNYEDVDIMRKLVDQDMNDAMLYSLKYTITDLVNKGCAVHPDTLFAYNAVVKRLKKGDVNSK